MIVLGGKPPSVAEGKTKRKALDGLVMLLKDANFEIGLKQNKSLLPFGKSPPRQTYFKFIDKDSNQITNIFKKFVSIFDTLEIKYTLGKQTFSSGAWVQIISLEPDQIEYIHKITFQYTETLRKYTWKLYQAQIKAMANNDNDMHKDFTDELKYNIIQKEIYDTQNNSSLPRKYICIPDQNGIYSTSNECNEYAHPNEITDRWTRKYLKYKMKYLNLKLLDK